MAITSERRLEAMRAYSKTPAGKAAKARSHQRYIEKRRANRIEELTVNAAPLAQALNNWSKQ